MTDEIKFDLFGNEVAPIRDRRGRPSFKKTPENQQFVAVRAAAQWTHEAIAADMGIDPKTLRKNFSRELSDGALMIEGQRLDVLSQKMREGNVSAARALEDALEKSQRRSAARRITNPKDEQPEEPAGKKGQAKRDAERAVKQGSWGADLDPGRYN